MKLLINKNCFILLIIFIIGLYHYYILNGIEKIFFKNYFDNKEFIKRPLKKCKKEIYPIKCVGMPSGHAEIITIISSLLYNYKYISLPICILLIFIISLQRIITSVHTILQVCIGILFGLIYSFIYTSNKLSYNCIVYISIITLTIVFAIIYKIEQETNKPIPEWVDKNMYKNIYKKRDSPLYMRILAILANSVFQEINFLSWDQLEKELDIIVDNIKKTNIQFDAVVGIKTGGAIISDYISKKLNIKNYKIKLSRSEYNCDKKPIHIFNDIYQRRILGNLGEYTICEKIEENIQNENIILIDERIQNGITMNEAIKYLNNEKNVKYIYPTCVSFSQIYNFDYDIHYVSKYFVLVWPWGGYDN
jgi:hypoxanthine phosphoribosyltransferase